MTRLIAADLLKLRRRRGLALSALLLCPAVAALGIVLDVSGALDVPGGDTFLEGMADGFAILGPVLAVLVGARLGSEERAAGTLRYQLLTGVSRARLLLSKLAVLVLACVAIAAAATLAATLGSVAAGDGGPGATAADVLDAAWIVLLPCLAYGAISLGVGLLLGSTGPAIAAALALNLVGLQLLLALVLIDDWFRHLVLDLGIDRLSRAAAGPDDRVSIGAAVVIVLAWPGAVLAAAWVRFRRLEA